MNSTYSSNTKLRVSIALVVGLFCSVAVVFFVLTLPQFAYSMEEGPGEV